MLCPFGPGNLRTNCNVANLEKKDEMGVPCLKAGVGNTDGEGLDVDSPLLVADDGLGGFDPAAQEPLAAVQEVHAVVVDVETNQVATCGSRKLLPPFHRIRCPLSKSTATQA